MNKNSRCGDPLQVTGRARGYAKKEIKEQLSRHADFSPRLLTQIEKLPEVSLRNSGSPLAKKLIRMMREISNEAYRAKQFTRTEINDRGVLYGVVRLKHRLADIVLRYFHERWPQCVICLFNELTTKTAVINEAGKIWDIEVSLEEAVQRISQKRLIIPYFEDLQISGKDIFETLYKSQNIIERENPRYFKSMIPNYCYKLPGLRNGIEKRHISRNKCLDDYLKLNRKKED